MWAPVVTTLQGRSGGCQVLAKIALEKFPGIVTLSTKDRSHVLLPETSVQFGPHLRDTRPPPWWDFSLDSRRGEMEMGSFRIPTSTSPQPQSLTEFCDSVLFCSGSIIRIPAIPCQLCATTTLRVSAVLTVIYIHYTPQKNIITAPQTRHERQTREKDVSQCVTHTRTQ